MDEEAEDEDDQEEQKMGGDQTKSRVQGNDKDKKIRGLLDDEDDESVDELSGDNSEEPDSKGNKANKTKAGNKKKQLAEANAAMQGADAQSMNEGAPRKRGRPSKKAKLEQEMQEKQSMATKRVKFDDGDKVVYPSDNESEDVPGLGEAEADGHPRLGGLDDDQAYETIVNNANGKSGLSVSLKSNSSSLIIFSHFLVRCNRDFHSNAQKSSLREFK